MSHTPGDGPADDRPAVPAEVPDGGPGGDPPAGPAVPWSRVAILAGLLLAAVVLVQVLTGDPGAEGAFEIEVDLDDRPGTARELADLLQERSDG